jgi:CBS domain-containing protein
MTPDPECLPDGAGVPAAGRQLAREGVGAMPTFNQDRRLTGIVSDGDVDRKLEEGDAAAGASVAELGGGVPVTISADAGIEEAARLMEQHGVRRLPVLDGKLLVGIVCKADLERSGPHAAPRAERRAGWDKPDSEAGLSATI